MARIRGLPGGSLRPAFHRIRGVPSLGAMSDDTKSGPEGGPPGPHEPHRTHPTHDESLFDTEPSPQPESVPSAEPASGDGASPPGTSAAGIAPPQDPGSMPRGGGSAESAAIADGATRTLDPAYVTLHRITGAIITAIVALNVLIGSPIVLLVVPLKLWANLIIIAAAAAFALFLAWFSWIWPAVEHHHIAYRVDPVGIEIRRGVVWRRIITVPRSRVQHTDVSQGPIERRYGLATLHIFTAGTEHSKVDLPGLAHATALKVRDHLAAGGEDDAV